MLALVRFVHEESHLGPSFSPNPDSPALPPRQISTCTLSRVNTPHWVWGKLAAWCECVLHPVVECEQGLSYLEVAWNPSRTEKVDGGICRSGVSSWRKDDCVFVIHEGSDDSSFLVPWSLWSPTQMTFISGWTARVGVPRLNTGKENKTGERKNRAEYDDLQRSHICFSTPTASLMNCCWGVQHPRAHQGPVHTDINVCSLFLLQWDVWFLCIDLFRVYWPIFPVLALKPFLAHRLIWSGTTTGPCGATWTLCYNNIKTVILGLDFCPFNRVSVCICECLTDVAET